MGKSIDKRLAELGGVRLAPLVCADEATGLEATVEEWKSAIFDQIVSHNSASD
jgi:sulfite reductase alpha subunit-like flavoprotein